MLLLCSTQKASHTPCSLAARPPSPYALWDGVAPSPQDSWDPGPPPPSPGSPYEFPALWPLTVAWAHSQFRVTPCPSSPPPSSCLTGPQAQGWASRLGLGCGLAQAGGLQTRRRENDKTRTSLPSLPPPPPSLSLGLPPPPTTLPLCTPSPLHHKTRNSFFTWWSLGLQGGWGRAGDTACLLSLLRAREGPTSERPGGDPLPTQKTEGWGGFIFLLHFPFPFLGLRLNRGQGGPRPLLPDIFELRRGFDILTARPLHCVHHQLPEQSFAQMALPHVGSLGTPRGPQKSVSK